MYGIIYWDRLNTSAAPRFLVNIDGTILCCDDLREADGKANAYETSTGNEACVVSLECVKEL